MFNSLGYSVYLSSFAAQQETLARAAGQDAMVFLSLHISEEFGDGYCQQAEALCAQLNAWQFRIIADVSTKTLAQFGEDCLLGLAKRLGIWALRIDYGFAEGDICALAAQMPVVLNASTTSGAAAARIAAAGAAAGNPVMAMHNFYPRPETGLDPAFLHSTTQELQAAGLKVLAFIPGDALRRAPLHCGLPTLEAHRDLRPSAAFADLTLHYGIDGVFLGDPAISAAEQAAIARYHAEDVLCIPCKLQAGSEALYGQVFTNRVDSPAWMVRFAESRVYSCFGADVAPANTVARQRGSITLDNRRYGRYSGEVQLLRADFAADERVNVIGSVPEDAHLLMDCIANGAKFVLAPA